MKAAVSIKITAAQVFEDLLEAALYTRDSGVAGPSGHRAEIVKL